ncbi:MAG: Zn-dependent alcohol dehydrogenase [Holophagales bacterium]|nr:Zn-dependent alcohol dehydrogenase [Acidobacteriota bacterium]MYB20712.1 Zn-dependent alcohol dehydrogenase [Holophagales bacterium]MYH23738.1 Zn-dependent alcohol dehydrogenase [Holophagales bacterium]
MKAAVFHEVGQPLEITDVAISKPGPHEILVRSSVVGVCHSDLHFVDGLWPIRTPAILGHEASGIVEEVGSEVRYVEPGDHVITCLSVFCGYCEYCMSGEPALCDKRATRRPRTEEPRLALPASNGGGPRPISQFADLASFAEQMLVHENAVVKIRKDMPLDRAAVIGCAVITGVGAAFRTAAVEPGSTVAVIGCGGIGLSTINGADLAGASRIIAIDRVASKLDLARAFGATDTIDASDGDTVKQVLDLTGGGVHYAFEAIGLKATAEQAWAMLRPGGTATVIGMVPMGQKVEIPGHELLQSKCLQGCTMGSNRFRVDMPRLVEFYLGGRLKLDELISDRIEFSQINEALQNLKTGEVARQVIVFDE